MASSSSMKDRANTELEPPTPSMTGSTPPEVRTRRGKPDGNEYQAQINGGNDFHVDSFTIGAVLGANYLYDGIEDYTERGSTGLELNYTDIEQQSLTSKVRAHASVALSTSFGIIVPQVTGEYVHESFDRQRRTDFRFVEDQDKTGFHVSKR